MILSFEFHQILAKLCAEISYLESFQVACRGLYETSKVAGSAGVNRPYSFMLVLRYDNADHISRIHRCHCR